MSHLRFPPLALLPLALALSVAACGSDDPEPTATAAKTPAPTATPHAEEEHDDRFEPGHSKAVRRYYRSTHDHGEPASDDGFGGGSEAEFHQPPRPAAGGIGDTITLTGTNLGIRMKVTVTGVEPAVRVDGRRYTAIRFRLVNDGGAIFEAPLTHAVVVDADGRRARAATGVKAPCSKGFDDILRIDVGHRRSGCVLFPAGARPERLLLALEQVPINAGGTWSLG